MTDLDLSSLLGRLQSLAGENEVVEFKEAKTSYDFNKLGKYFSALSNEASLNGKDCAWLIFGIENKSHKIVGSHFRIARNDLDGLKREIAEKTNNRITFIEIYELETTQGRVVLFQIPPAPRGMPVSFEGHFYGREGESLAALSIEEMERIRFQSRMKDWSAETVELST